MGKKKHKDKHKKKQKHAEEATSDGAREAASPLHRAGQLLLEQARSPMGRQLIASGLMVAAAALARETSRGGTSAKPDTDPEAAKDAPPPPPASDRSDAAALAGLALSALDHVLNRRTPPDQA